MNFSRSVSKCNLLGGARSVLQNSRTIDQNLANILEFLPVGAYKHELPHSNLFIPYSPLNPGIERDISLQVIRL